MEATRIDMLEGFTLSETEQLAKWKSRSILHRLSHRKNVIIALTLGEITFRSCWFGLRYAHNVSFLAKALPNRGYIFVCPELKQSVDQ